MVFTRSGECDWTQHAQHWLANRRSDQGVGFAESRNWGATPADAASACGPFVRTQREAWKVLEGLRSRSQFIFFDESAGLDQLFRGLSSRDQVAPKLWTDDYLAAFASAANLTLVTFDRALAARAPSAQLLTP